MKWTRVVLTGNYLKWTLKKVKSRHTFESSFFELFFKIVVVEIRNLDKRPYKVVELPQQEILDLPKDGLQSWNDQSPDLRNFCEETVFRIKSKIVKRQLYLEPCFKDLDA